MHLPHPEDGVEILNTGRLGYRQYPVERITDYWYMLIAIGLSPSGSIAVHIYTQYTENNETE